ncbi:MAG: hypothetical protein E3J43_09980 [Candidatus Heimdallarchaeota archaeon]|nr:MAG: hypothetical protein E3J43_09980 [Candidatus Heimdallarchaeota archaeon]
MKIETLWELLQDEKYACLSVVEFVEIIKNSKVMEDFEPFPSFAEESIRLHEEKMARTEEKERMADYLDQKEGE